MGGKISAALAAGLALAGWFGAVATPASATVWNDSFVYTNGANTCSTSITPGHDICYQFQGFDTLRTGVAGDTYNVNMTVANGESTFVPGSQTQNWMFIIILDSSAPAIGLGTPTPEFSYAYVAPSGYNGPPNPYIYSFNWYDYGYSSIVGFCCGTPPNNGFSLTGANAAIHTYTYDPNPLVGILVGYDIIVPEPSVWALLLVGFGLIGASFRARPRVVGRGGQL